MRRSRFRHVLLFACVALLAAAGQARSGEGRGPEGRLVMAMEELHRVSAYSPGGELLASGPTGLRPRSLALVGEDRILVTNRGRDSAPGSSLTLLSAEGLEPLETIAACNGCAPAGLLVDGEGRVYVGAQHHKAVTVFDGPSGPALRTLLTPWGWPGEIVPHPWADGVAVGFRDTNDIGLIEFAGRRPQNLAIEIDPSELAPRPGHDELWVGTRIGRLAIVVPDEESYARIDEMLVVERPLDLAFEPNGARLFGASAQSHYVWYIDADTRQPAGSIPLGGSVAHLLAFSPGGRYLAVALYHEQRCLIYDVSVEGEPALVGSFSLPSRPRAMLWLP